MRIHAFCNWSLFVSILGKMGDWLRETTFVVDGSGYTKKRRKVVTKTLRAMQLTAVLMTMCCISVSAKTVSQSITYRANDVKLETLFDVIRQQTGLYVFYNSEQIDKSTKIDINAKNLPLADFMNRILANQDLTYTLDNTTLIIEKKPATDLSPRLMSPSLTPPPITVRGRIVNEKGEPVIVSVIIKGSKRGTTTNEHGTFVLENVADNAVLVISGANIETREINVNNHQEINITVTTRISNEEEVVINGGYYKTTDRTKTGSISKVTAKDIEKQPVTSPLLALQGRVPGLEITPQSGVSGSAPKIRVRGQNSLRTPKLGLAGVVGEGNLPLYVIDGVQINSNAVGSFAQLMPDGYDPLSTLNPVNIESIEVLKDADATAIYGSRGANGVILITTKQVKRTDKTSFDLSVYSGGGKVANSVELLNTQQYLQMRKEAFANDGMDYTDPGISYATADLMQWDTTKYTDWQKKLIGGTATTTDITGAISGGSANLSYRLGAGYHKETTVYPGDFNYQKTSAFLSVNHRTPDNRFTSAISINYGVDNNRFFKGALVGAALRLPPNAPALYDEEGNLNWEPDPVYGFSTFYDNPLATIKSPVEATNNSLAANAKLEYEFFKGFSVKMNVGYNRFDGEESIKTTFASMLPENRYSINNPFGIKASVGLGANKRISTVLEPTINYNRNFKLHQFNIVAGTTYQKSENTYQHIQGSEYTSDALLNSINAAPVLTYVVNDFAESKYASVFGRIGYRYNNKYLLSINGRRDGSSRFGPGNRYGNFGSIAGGWIFTEEKIWGNLKHILDFGKIRASYGIAGNDQIGDYSYYNLYRMASFNYQNETSLSPNSLLNPSLVWEKTRKAEIALELSFLSSRINVEAIWYTNRSSNQLTQYPLPGTTGFDYIYTNFGALIENRGWEFVLRSENIQTKSFRWSTSFNLTIARNELKKFDGIESSPYSKFFKVGEPLSIQRLYLSKGVNPATGLFEFEDVNDDGIIDDDDRQFMKPDIQPYYGGILNSFRYKNFDLSFLVQFAERFGVIADGSRPGSPNNQPISVLDRWQKPGDVAQSQIFSQLSYGEGQAAYDNYLRSNSNVRTVSFIRLKTLSLSYRIPGKLFQFLNEPGVFLQGQNLFTITDYPNLDPETGNALPPLRMLTLGVQFKL